MRFDMRGEVLEEEVYIQCSVTDRALRRLAPGFQVAEGNIRKAFDQHRATIERIASEKFDAHKVELSGNLDTAPDRRRNLLRVSHQIVCNGVLKWKIVWPNALVDVAEGETGKAVVPRGTIHHQRVPSR